MLRRLASILLAASFLTRPVFMAQDAKLEDRLKAVFIVNFVQYVEWPSQGLASSFNICIVGDSFRALMEDAVRGERIEGRNMAVKSLSSADNVSGCQLIYFRDTANPKTVSDILAASKSLPVLTVGETREFIQNGGIIRFTKAGNRMRFEINAEAAAKRSLSVSSRLLRLADIVQARNP